MMNEMVKTLVYVAAAVVLCLVAFFTVPGVQEPAFYDDEGQLLFEEFTDPTTATALEVVAFDSETASYSPFRVEQKEGLWSIPSHHFYPADAEDEMAKAAALVVGLKKDRVVSDDPADHALYGVVNPKDEGIDTEGRGTLVTFQDAGGNALASLIVGTAVEGKTDQRYVRLPEHKRTYVTKLQSVPSTKFEDWIETDLLDTSAYDILKLTFDNYTMRESGMRIERIDGPIVEAGKQDNEWALVGLAENEETNKTTVGAVGTELAELKIVGVRPKPAGLSRALTGEGGLTQEAQISLQNRGFYLTQDGHLLSNEGDLLARTRTGVAYTLRFGEILFGTGDELTAGAEDEASKPAGEESEETDDSVQANRYLMVTAHFDESMLERPALEGMPLDEMDKRRDARLEMEKILAAIGRWKTSHEDQLPETLAVLTEGDVPELTGLEKDSWGNDFVYTVEEDQYWLTSLGADGAEGGEGVNLDVTSKEDWAAENALVDAAEKWEEFQRKVKEGQEEADRLSRRFAPWYYVVDEESFRKLRPSRDELVTIKEPEEEPEAGPVLPDAGAALGTDDDGATPSGG